MILIPLSSHCTATTRGAFPALPERPFMVGTRTEECGPCSHRERRNKRPPTEKHEGAGRCRTPANLQRAVYQHLVDRVGSIGHRLRIWGTYPDEGQLIIRAWDGDYGEPHRSSSASLSIFCCK